MNMLTYQEFITTKKIITRTDYCREFGGGDYMVLGESVLVYDKGYFISDISTPTQQCYHLYIERSEWESPILHALEEMLYEFYNQISGGYDESIDVMIERESNT